MARFTLPSGWYLPATRIGTKQLVIITPTRHRAVWSIIITLRAMVHSTYQPYLVIYLVHVQGNLHPSGDLWFPI